MNALSQCHMLHKMSPFFFFVMSHLADKIGVCSYSLSGHLWSRSAQEGPVKG